MCAYAVSFNVASMGVRRTSWGMRISMLRPGSTPRDARAGSEPAPSHASPRLRGAPARPSTN
eukprot:9386719-Pyramimonas_sp.AAC.1